MMREYFASTTGGAAVVRLKAQNDDFSVTAALGLRAQVKTS